MKASNQSVNAANARRLWKQTKKSRSQVESQWVMMEQKTQTRCCMVLPNSLVARLYFGRCCSRANPPTCSSDHGCMACVRGCNRALLLHARARRSWHTGRESTARARLFAGARGGARAKVRKGPKGPFQDPPLLKRKEAGGV